MTERFIVDDAGTLIDMQTRDMFDIVEEVCPLLNELAEENQHLKGALKELKEIGDYQAKRINELNDENEQLRTKNNAYIQDIEVYKEENTHLKLENEHIKQTIKDMLENERTELGRSVLKQLWEQIQ